MYDTGVKFGLGVRAALKPVQVTPGPLGPTPLPWLSPLDGAAVLEPHVSAVHPVAVDAQSPWFRRLRAFAIPRFSVRDAGYAL